jgi:hypothetical protein
VRALAGLALLLAVPAAAAAQPYAGTSAPHRGSIEVSGGALWTRGYDAGGSSATLTRNPTTGTAPLTLFAVTSEMLSATGGDARVGIFLGRRLSAEAGIQYSRAVLRAHVTGDFETAPDTDVDGLVTSYLAGGSLVYHLGGGHLVPYVLGGGGYLRQLHDANTDLLTGHEIHAGGGVKYWPGTGARRLGLRIEAQGSSRNKSAAFTQKRRVVPAVTAGLVFLF